MLRVCVSHSIRTCKQSAEGRRSSTSVNFTWKFSSTVIAHTCVYFMRKCIYRNEAIQGQDRTIYFLDNRSKSTIKYLYGCNRVSIQVSIFYIYVYILCISGQQSCSCNIARHIYIYIYIYFSVLRRYTYIDTKSENQNVFYGQYWSRALINYLGNAILMAYNFILAVIS